MGVSSNWGGRQSSGTAVAPNMRIDLPSEVFGPDSYLAIYEETKDAKLGNLPPPSSPGGGATGTDGDHTYISEITVNMIRVHITDQFAAVDDDLSIDPTADAAPLDVTVSSATAYADFPRRGSCAVQVEQTVSGNAYMLSATTTPSLLPVMQGYVEIPSIGGHAHQGYKEGEVPQAHVGLWATDSFGEIDNVGSEASSRSSSYAQAANVCLLPEGDTCTISAEAVRSQSNSSMSGTTRTHSRKGLPTPREVSSPS